jgi:hypothetical protein
MHHSRYSSNASESTGFDIYATGCVVPLGVRIRILQPARALALAMAETASNRQFV